MTESTEIVLRLRPLPGFGRPLVERLGRAVEALRRCHGLECTAQDLGARLPAELLQVEPGDEILTA